MFKKYRIVWLLLLLILCAAAVPGKKVEVRASNLRQLKAKAPCLSMTRDEIELKKGKRKYIGMLVFDAERSDIVWSSSNKNVAVVNKLGIVKGKKVGKAKITARIRGTDIEETCEVNVVNYKIYRVKATAYCNCASCSGPGHPRTASGTYPKQGRTLAVDKRLIPKGTKIEMNGHTYYAEDTGGAIKGKKIDVYFHRHSDTGRWGVRYVLIKVFYDK